MNVSPTSARLSALIVRYHEIALKGSNRALFEKRLERNLRLNLDHIPSVRIRRIRGRMLVQADAPAEQLLDSAKRVFGASSFSPAFEVEANVAAIAETAGQLIDNELATSFVDWPSVPFRISVNRAAKRHPMTSIDWERAIANEVMPARGQLKVNLSRPELNVEVDLRDEGTWVFAERVSGEGGLPVGVMGRGFCLLSGGIDSPVAAWLCMKRGMRVDYMSFYSFPHVGPQTKDKIIRQVENLSRWQPQSTLHIVPFAHIQEAIRDSCPASYRTVLYRRAMQRLATKIAFRNKGKALVTGESVGQVASQTLENLTVIEDASGMPVLRPLVTYDKQETIHLAQRIGTFETSNLPAPDCCTVFQPEHPVIQGRLEEALAAEESLDLDSLNHTSIRGIEKIHIPNIR